MTPAEFLAPGRGRDSMVVRAPSRPCACGVSGGPALLRCKGAAGRPCPHPPRARRCGPRAAPAPAPAGTAVTSRTRRPGRAPHPPSARGLAPAGAGRGGAGAWPRWTCPCARGQGLCHRPSVCVLCPPGLPALPSPLVHRPASPLRPRVCPCPRCHHPPTPLSIPCGYPSPPSPSVLRMCPFVCLSSPLCLSSHPHPHLSSHPMLYPIGAIPLSTHLSPLPASPGPLRPPL